MSCTPTTLYVSLNKDTLKKLIRQKLHASILAACGSIPHHNRDAYYSPSQWWYDAEKTQRHTLETSASMNFANDTLKIQLQYNIHST